MAIAGEARVSALRLKLEGGAIAENKEIMRWP